MSIASDFTWRYFVVSRRDEERQPRKPTMSLTDVILASIIPFTILLHLLVSPYSKVEESFNIQATHDILKYGIPIRNSSNIIAHEFDHGSFPGSVPRTFIGALCLSILAKPFTFVITSPDRIQLVCRAILGLLNAAALWSVKAAVDTAYGRTAGRWYLIIQASQFHVMYYASRTLPNMFAFIFTTVATRQLILAKTVTSKSARTVRRRKSALFLLTVAGVVFRSEIAILLAAETMSLLLQHRSSLTREVIPTGVAGLALGLSATLFVDSLFWQQFPLWPELKGFYFNTILGKSSEWGTSPIYFYFFNALPRLLLNPLLYLFCIPCALIVKAPRRTSINILAPHLAFIAVYSFLAHKEWRFIVYSIPAFNAVASAAPAYIWTRRSKSIVYGLLNLVMIMSVIASFIASFGLLYISSLNYPGGDALATLHRLTANNATSNIAVYMDNLACQSGVTRFQQIRSNWVYDKTEDQDQLLEPLFWQRFDYAIVEHRERTIGLWQSIATIDGFAGATIRPAADSDTLPLPASLQGSWISKIHQQYSALALFIRQRFTKGYWPAVKTVPKLYIMERLPPSLSDENVQT